MKKEKITPRYATPETIGQMFNFSPGTLANLRSQKKGCPYFRRGRRIYYSVSDFENWLKESPVLKER
jgi:hypothetical protein